jgi:HD-like signal output (HDOD) protein
MTGQIPTISGLWLQPDSRMIGVLPRKAFFWSLVVSLEALFAVPANLPTIPKVVQQLIQSFSRDDVSVDDIASKLAADPVLSAKTLRLANSAYFHVSRSISTVDDALRMLGFVMVRNLVVGCGMTGAFKAVPGMDLPQFWRYSLNTACTARWLAQAGGHNADLAFTVGLMHGLGQLMMHVAAPAAMKPLDKACNPLAGERAALEQAELGYHHGTVSAEMARRWKFPAEVASPLDQAPLPAEGSPIDPLAAIIHLAAWRARVEALHFTPQDAAPTWPARVAGTLAVPVVWLPEAATLGGDHPALTPPMPPLEELSRGLDSMLH